MEWQELQSAQERLHELIDKRFERLLSTVGSEIHVNREELCGAIYDGCLDVKKYVNAPKRIMWILKEHNATPASVGSHWVAFADALGDRSDKDLEHFKASVASYRALRLVERASRVLMNVLEYDSTETFKSIAVVNLGKCPGGSKTPLARVPRLVEWWGDVLVRQVEDYRPDIILIPGNHFSHVASLLKNIRYLTKQEVKTGSFAARAELYDMHGTPVVHIQHPAWYGCVEDDWVDAIQKVLASKGHAR